MLCNFSIFKNVWPLSETSHICSFFFFFFLFFFGALGLPCCVWGFFSSCSEWGYSLVAVHELLFAVVLREKFMYF